MKYYRITEEQIKKLSGGNLNESERFAIIVDILANPVQERGALGNLSDAVLKTIGGARELMEDACTKKP
ncbi:MAG: hypothetical protein ABFC78_00540 [Methanoregula sp.]